MQDQMGNQPPHGHVYQEAAQTAVVPDEAKNMSAMCHALGFFWIFGPLLVWLITRDRHKFIDDCGKSAVNYQISMGIYLIISGLLCIILIGIPLLFILHITNFVLVIKATLAAGRGEVYRYPIAMKFIS